MPLHLNILDSNQPGDSAGGTMCPAHGARAAASVALPRDIAERHPCYSMGSPGEQRAGRLHLPVSPACNIACRFCRRDFNATEHRPGVAHSLLSPDKALGIVERALELCPSIQVVGIAGPGDTLATDHAINTFELVNQRFPSLINCLSTNGLLLPEKGERVVAAGVQTITVTVNAVDPNILTGICSGIVFHGTRLSGTAATNRLIRNQLAGIKLVTDLGAVVKVNTVLVPGVNDHHIADVARTVAEAGASLINVIPLIPEHELIDNPAPTAEQITQARADAERYLSVFLHCKRCRADACGVPGQGPDFANQLYGVPVAAETFSHG